MSHMVYPNLARLEHFQERGLNYTGIILDDWNSPTLLAHPLALLLLLGTAGWPRGGWQSWWLMLNIVIIHPLDFFVGGLGIGPKYLLDEYAVYDTRYWVLNDPMTAWITYQEVAIMLPLEYLWYRALQRNHWSRHYWAVVAGTFQLMGTIFYFGCEWSDGFTHLPEIDWPPRFDTYLKLKYFWFIFVFLNMIWVVIPLYLYYEAYVKLRQLIEKAKLD